ncbi:glutathione S-transferase [Rhizobium sp. BK060]|nr:glutathione S-transferase [Rhizobium sp. BK060]
MSKPKFYAPMRIQNAIYRFSMEVKRQLDVLDRHLADHHFMSGDEYSIADIAIWPWYGNLAQGNACGDAGIFLNVQSYSNLQRWTAEIADRPAVKRGR